MRPAPIALFAYNRPQHLARAVSALQANELACASELHIFSDGPKKIGDVGAVEQVREEASRVTGFARLHVYEQANNMGLAASVISGVTELCKRYGRVIVMEDDLVVAPGFLQFMNQALARYEHDSQVMQISGYMFPVAEMREVGSTFFCRIPTSWGWATWQRAWTRFEQDSGKLLRMLPHPAVRDAFNVDGAYPYFEHLTLHAEGKMDVWGVRWYASMFLSDGLTLYPNRSLVRNTGMDGSGVHCGSSRAFDVELSEDRRWQFPDRIEPSMHGYEAIRTFLLALRQPKPEGTWTDWASRFGAALNKVRQAVTLAAR
jgi:hypothetical protein